MRRWFLSYHSADLALAERFEAMLRRNADAQVFFAPKNLRAGGYWQPALAEEIAQATAFVLLVGEKGLGPWQVVEYYEALDKRVKAPDFPIVLMLLDGQPAPGLPFLRQLHWIVSADPASEQAVARLAEAAAGGGDRPGELWRYASPYRGLAAMTEADSDFFFGRERETVEVLAALAADADRLPVLLGNSGVGKSSLAQAGVLAALKRQSWPEIRSDAAATGNPWPHAFRESRHWCFLALKPGTEPLKSLVTPFLDTWQLGATDPERIKQQNGWIELLRDGKAALRDLLDATERRYEELHQRKPPAFFLYVDQGEELYVRADERQRRRFSELLAQELGDPRLAVLMSLRSDFLGALQNDEPLYAVHRKIDVTPLRERELAEVVSRPAALLAARFETDALAPDIARRAAEESAKDAGALPLLSYLLDDMWTQMVERGDGVLRLPPQAMELGGVLAERANAFLAAHPKAEETLRRVLTLKLATVREDGEPTRRLARRSEFTNEEWRLVSELADHPHRLLVTAAPEGGETYAEVAHEALFRRWDRLREWMAAEREFLVWRSGLEADRRSWEQASPASRNDALLMGLALAQAQSWLAKRAEDLPRGDREFIDLSLKREQLERRQKEALRRRVLIVALAALAIVTGLAVFAGLQWREAVKQEQIAQRERERAEQALADVPKSAFAYLARGLAYLTKGDYDRALSDFDEGIKLDPTNPVAYQGRGIAYYRKKEYDRAIAEYDHAIELDPRGSAYYQGRGDVYNDKDEPARAVADYDRAIELDPRNSPAYRGRGDVYHGRGDYDRAIKEYDQAVLLDPKNVPAYRGRGNSYRAKRLYDRAVADYGQAISLDRTDDRAYNGRGNVYWDAREYDRAIADYDQAIRLDPKSAIYYDNRANAYRAKGDYDRARADYDQAIKLDPNYARAYNDRGNAYWDKQDYDRAIADYNQAIKLDPRPAYYYFNRGNAYRVKGDYDRAIADYDQAIERNRDYADAYNYRGLVYGMKGDADRAIADYDAVIRLQPANAGAYWSRALMELYSNKASSAVDDLVVALALAPSSHYTVIWLHIARTRAGQSDLGELASNGDKLDRTKWPWPVVGLFLGSLRPEDVRAAARSADSPGTRNDQICEADFFIGIYQHEKGALNEARRSFQSVADMCPKSLVGHGAKLELGRLR